MKGQLDTIESHKKRHDEGYVFNEQYDDKTIPLYDLMHVYQKKYGPANPDINEFFESIVEDRKKRHMDDALSKVKAKMEKKIDDMSKDTNEELDLDQIIEELDL